MNENKDLALPQTLRDKLRATVLERFIDLIPEQQLSDFIDAEVEAFFETETPLVLDHRSTSSGNSSYRTNERESFSLNITAKMTPFRQLVWGI